MTKEDCEKKGITLGRFLLAATILLAGCVSAFTIVKVQAGNNATNMTEHKAAATISFDKLEKDIEELDDKKVEKEIFRMYLNAEKEKFDASQKVITDGFGRFDKRLEKIENKL